MKMYVKRATDGSDADANGRVKKQKHNYQWTYFNYFFSKPTIRSEFTKQALSNLSSNLEAYNIIDMSGAYEYYKLPFSPEYISIITNKAKEDRANPKNLRYSILSR